MKAKSRIGIVAAAVIMALLAFPALVIADTMIKQTEHMDAMEVMGQKTAARTDTTISWLGKNRARIDKGDTASFILHMDEGKAYILNHSTKTYGEISLAPVDEKTGKAGKDEPEKMTEAMKQMMKIDGKVSATDETKKINNWNCRKYNVDLKLGMVTMKQEIWASEDVKVDYEMFQRASNAMMSQLSGYDEFLKEMKKIKGLPIHTIINVNLMGSTMTRTLDVFEIKEKSSPPGGYEIPKDYKKTSAPTPMQMGP